MPWSDAPLRTLTIPQDATTGTPRIVLNASVSDGTMPPELAAFYTGVEAIIGATLWYPFTDDNLYYYEGLISTPAVVRGWVYNQTTVQEQSRTDWSFGQTSERWGDNGQTSNIVFGANGGGGAGTFYVVSDGGLVVVGAGGIDIGNGSFPNTPITRSGIASKLTVGEGLTRASANTNFNAVIADVAGTSQTYNVVSTNTTWKATGVFDCNQAVADATVATGLLDLDGVTQTGQAIFSGRTAGVRATVVQQWSGTFGSTGNHTFKLRTQRAGGADGSIAAQQTHTCLSVELSL